MLKHRSREAQKRSCYGSYPSLRGRVVLVTGGATGIGSAIVEHFVQQGSRVVFLDIQDAAASQLVKMQRGNGESAPHFMHCDLTDINEVAGCVRAILKKFKTVDVLVNNAGNDDRHPLEKVTPQYWDRSMAVNLKHHFFLSQAVIPAMKRAGCGSIINLSSIAWMIPSTGLPVYVTAKAAIVGLTRTLAHEVGRDNIRVNCVLPGAIVTKRQQELWLTDAYKGEIMGRQALKRMIMPEEVARLILFLASDDSSAITSQSHIIDAGWV